MPHMPCQLSCPFPSGNETQEQMVIFKCSFVILLLVGPEAKDKLWSAEDILINSFLGKIAANEQWSW